MSAETETRLDAIMEQINAFGYGTVEYHRAMWFLLSTMAARQAIIADRLDADRRRREARARVEYRAR